MKTGLKKYASAMISTALILVSMQGFAQTTEASKEHKSAAKPLQAASYTQADVERVTDLLIAMFPLGELMDEMAQNNPEWPLLDKAKNVTAAKLACIRSELSSEGLRRQKVKDVLAYAEDHPATFTENTKILDVVSKIIGRFVGVGIKSAKNPGKSDKDEELNQASEDFSDKEMTTFMLFMMDSKYTDVRNLSGMGNFYNPDNTPEQNRQNGRELGKKFVATAMLTAMQTCEISLTELK